MAKSKVDEWLTDDGLQKIKDWKAQGLTDVEIANNMGINPCTLFDYKNKYPDISNAIKEGSNAIIKVVENQAIKLMQGYDYFEDTYERISDDRQKTRHKGDVSLTQKEWEFCLKYFNYRCAYCDTDITGTDANSKRSKATKDHVIPLESGGKMDKHNIIPACQQCNSAKNKSEMKEWYSKQKFYADHRLKKINDYLKLMDSIEDDSEPELVLTKRVKKHVKPDTTMIIFFLKSRAPELYAEWMQQKNFEIENSESEIQDSNVLLLPEINAVTDHPDEQEVEDE